MNTHAARVVVVLDAGSVEGCRAAQSLLADGCQVVATDRRAADLVRIVYGQCADNLLLLAAGADQLNQVLARARTRFGRVDAVIRPTPYPLPLSA